MDYSAANTTLWRFIIQMGIIAATILLSNFLLRRISWIRKSMMPTAVLGGFILLILRAIGVLTMDMELMQILVYHAIALGFIAMSLRVTHGKKIGKNDLTGAKSGALIVGTYLVQGITGLIITITLGYTLMPHLLKAAGLLLPMGYGQGPGQANNVGSTYEALGFAGGRSFGLAIAAAGYICACLVGVAMLAVRAAKGKQPARTAADAQDLTVSFFQDKNEIPVSDSIDKFSIQLMLVLVVYLCTYLVTWGLTSAISAVAPGAAGTVNTLIWGFNFIVGSALATLTRVLLEKLRSAGVMQRQYQNNYLLNRLSGVFFDIMIVAGIASIDLEDLTGLWLPFALMAVSGGVVTWIYLRWICKKVYADYYDEGLISMYGMMTGTIGSGVLLLRQIDPDFETPAANNLVTGSSFGIIFGIPMLILVGMAAKSDLWCLITLVLASLYLVALLLFICCVGRKDKKGDKQ
jgi:ESS family glutamate:Na+ symporter